MNVFGRVVFLLLFTAASVISGAVLSIAVGCGGDTKSTNIGPAGGSLVSSDSKFTLTIPAGALGASTRLTLTKLLDDELDPILRSVNDLNLNYLLDPSGLTFAISSTGTLRLSQDDAADYLQDAGLSNVVIISSENSEPTYLDSNFTSIDQDTGEFVARGTIDHFSYETASNGIISFAVSPAGILGAVGSASETSVTLQGRSNFGYGNYGNIQETRLSEAVLGTDVPDFITIDPGTVDISSPAEGVPTVNQTFEITCDAQGTDTISFYLDKPQTYFFVKTGETLDYTNNSQFGVTIPIVCAEYAGVDEPTSTMFSVLPNPGSASVEGEVSYDLTLLAFQSFANVAVTATIGDPNVAGASPQTIDPFPSEKYYSQKQTMSFTCFEAGTTSVAFQLVADDSVVIDLTVPLTCT